MTKCVHICFKYDFLFSTLADAPIDSRGSISQPPFTRPKDMPLTLKKVYLYISFLKLSYLVYSHHNLLTFYKLSFALSLLDSNPYLT